MTSTEKRQFLGNLPPLLRGIGTLSSMTAMSRVLGFVRDIVLAAVLGAGAVADAFFVALKLPNLFRRLTAEGAMTSAFLPSYTKLEAKQGKHGSMALLTDVQSSLVWALIIIVLLFEAGMPWVISVLAPGFIADHRLVLAVDMARATMPFLPMISLVALWIAVANAYKRFAAGGLMPIIMNLMLITAALTGFVLWGEAAARGKLIAYAVSVAGVIQLLVMGAVLLRLGYLPKIQLLPRFTPEARAMWRRFWPTAFAAAGMQVNLLVDTMLASLLSVGAIAQLYYADRVAQLPLGVVGIAIGTVLLPSLARHEAAATTNKKAVAAELHSAITIGMLAAIPSMLGGVIIAEVIIGGLFVYGAFDPGLLTPTAQVLMAYSLGIPAFILVKTLQPAFYAAGDVRLPVRVTTFAIVLNIILSVVLMQVFAAAGIALATSLAAWLSSVILAAALVKRRRLNQTVLSPIFRITICAGIMAAALLVALPMTEGMLAWLRLLLLLAIGMASYIIPIMASGVCYHIVRK